MQDSGINYNIYTMKEIPMIYRPLFKQLTSLRILKKSRLA